MRYTAVFLLLLAACLLAFAADLNQLSTQANSGDSEAQYRLGLMYRNGDGVQRDLTQALAWFEKAARQGHSGAMYDLAVANYNGNILGDSTREDVKAAWVWFELAAAAGRPDAESEAARVATEMGNARHHSASALLLEQLATYLRTPDASRWMRADSDAGHIYAGLTEARRHLSAIKSDERSARAACERITNDAGQAHFCMGLLYEMNEAANLRRAADWYKKSAERREPHAMFRLGLLLSDPKSPNHDAAAAYYWMLLAKAYGDTRAEAALTSVGTSVSSKDRQRAIRKAVRFEDGHRM